MDKYEWVTDEMFDRKLAEILDKMSGGDILQVGSAYDVFSEALNNRVLDELMEERGTSVSPPESEGARGEWKGGANR